MKNRGINLLIIVLIFLTVYYPPIMSFNVLYIISPISMLLLFYESALKKKNIVIGKSFLKICGMLLIVLLHQVVMSLVSGGNVLVSISQILLILVGVLPVVLLIYNLIAFYKISLEQVMNDIITVGVIQSILAIIAYINPGFQKWFIDRMIVYGYEASRFSSLSSFRWFGVATQLGFTTPMVQAIIAILCIYLGMEKSWKYHLLAALLLFSAVINARTSIVLFVVALFFVIFFYFKSNCNRRALNKFLLFSMSFVILIVVALNVMKYISPQNYLWAVQGLVTSIFGGQEKEEMYLMTGSFFLDKDNWMMPAGGDFLCGTGYSLDQANYSYYTDIGYVNDVWKYGFLLSIIIFICLAKLMLSIKSTRIGWVFSISFLVFFLLGNLKGDLVTMNTFTPFVLLICSIMNSCDVKEPPKMDEFGRG